MLADYKLFLLQVIMACQLYGTLAEKMMRPNFKDIKLWSDEQYVTHKISYDAKDPHLNFTLDVLHEAHDIDLHLEAKLTNKLDPFYSTTWNSTINLCRVLNWSAKSPVGNLVHSLIKQSGKIIESCPIAKGQYKMHKFWWPEDATIVMFPEIDFVFDFHVFHLDANKKRKLVINDHISGELVVQDVDNIKPGIFAMLPKLS